MIEFRRFSEKSDVYSFGVFLLELVSGREATESPSFDSNQNLVEWVCDCLNTVVNASISSSKSYVDQQMIVCLWVSHCRYHHGSSFKKKCVHLLVHVYVFVAFKILTVLCKLYVIFLSKLTIWL